MNIKLLNKINRKNSIAENVQVKENVSICLTTERRQSLASERKQSSSSTERKHSSSSTERKQSSSSTSSDKGILYVFYFNQLYISVLIF